MISPAMVKSLYLQEAEDGLPQRAHFGNEQRQRKQKALKGEHVEVGDRHSFELRKLLRDLSQDVSVRSSLK